MRQQGVAMAVPLLARCQHGARLRDPTGKVPDKGGKAAVEACAALLGAAAEGDLAGVTKALQAGAAANCRAEGGETPLLQLAAEQQTRVAPRSRRPVHRHAFACSPVGARSRACSRPARPRPQRPPRRLAAAAARSVPAAAGAARRRAEEEAGMHLKTRTHTPRRGGNEGFQRSWGLMQTAGSQKMSLSYPSVWGRKMVGIPVSNKQITLTTNH